MVWVVSGHQRPFYGSERGSTFRLPGGQRRRQNDDDFSTHQLEQAEELCQDIVIINKGQSVLQGSVREVKRQHGRNVARLKLDNDPEVSWLEQLPDVQVTKRREDYIEMQIQVNFNPNVIGEAALQH